VYSFKCAVIRRVDSSRRAQDRYPVLRSSRCIGTGTPFDELKICDRINSLPRSGHRIAQSAGNRYNTVDGPHGARSPLAAGQTALGRILHHRKRGPKPKPKPKKRAKKKREQ